MDYGLKGSWQVILEDGSSHSMMLPGTLDENGIGYRDVGANQWHPDENAGNAAFRAEDVIATRFTRKYTYEGAARMSRRISCTVPEGKRVFLEAERARCLKLWVDGKEVPDFIEPSISTPHVFEITGLLNGDNELTLVSDNSYPGLPHDDIVYSSAATDETQTNWNGVLGNFGLRIEDAIFISAIRVYPKNRMLKVMVEVSAAYPWEGEISVRSEALDSAVSKRTALPEGLHEIMFDGLKIREDVSLWDEGEGNLYELTVCLAGMKEKKVSFGVRDFGDDGNGRLSINGRTIFLRSEANCAEFPETGHPPMDAEAWVEILKLYQSYGVNCMRFHSHCPPEAAFTAADRLGMLMQPELSCWNPKDAFETEERFDYYRRELGAILKMLANHPSFVMLTLGNELQAGETGHRRMDALLELARCLDDTRLYANGSNVHYGAVGCDEKSDFYASQKFFEEDLRGTFAGESDGLGIKGYLNNRYPDAGMNYDRTMEKIREVYQKPVFSFEVGQFEVLPDFDELEDFQGISDPANLRLIRKRVEERGLLDVWKRYVEATGELSRIGYREEIEAAMRTGGLSGISLLGLQDFPGQGTALVGMLNSHLKPKPFAFARPESFRAFFTDQLPLAELPKYTFESAEILRAQVMVANFGKKEVKGCLTYELTEAVTGAKGCGAEHHAATKKDRAEERRVCASGSLFEVCCPTGGLSCAGWLEIPLTFARKACRLDLKVEIGGLENAYPIWVYPHTAPVCPASVYETEHFDRRAVEVLEAGGKVYLTPPSTKEALPHSIRAQFTTDFWSVGTFSGQEGSMGQLIDVSHPVFESFPTEFHTNWQWWPMAVQRAVILPRNYAAIITEMDSYAYLRPMAQLLECRLGKGKLMLSSMGLQNLQQYPEARALLDGIYRYMDSERFCPEQEIDADVIRELVN